MRMVFISTVLLAAMAPAGIGARSTPPHLRIVDHTPLSLRGEHFKAGERVTLLVKLGQTKVKRRVIATAAGSFTAVFKTLRLDRCTSLHVEAAGSKGSQVSFGLETTLGCPSVSTH